MKKGELVTVDFGSIDKGYQSDQTITFCLGKATKKQKLVYNNIKICTFYQSVYLRDSHLIAAVTVHVITVLSVHQLSWRASTVMS